MVNNPVYARPQPVTGVPTYQTPYPQNPFQQIFVQGIEGARAYQLPYGVTAAVLWDSEKDLFYLKQIDQMGRPFIAKICSYADYEEPKIEPESNQNGIDSSQFVTKEYLDNILNRLLVGERGRIVIDESDG